MVDTLRPWLTDAALPFWGTAGFDRVAGRFHERLDRAGGRLAVPQRSMVQARQIYVFAHAAHMGWYPEGAALADTAMRSLRRDFERRNGADVAFAFSIAPDGRPLSEVWDAYGHAFVLFAVAWLHRVTGDPALPALADAVLLTMDRHMGDATHGGYRDQHPVGDTTKRQNPHMHLLEALLALDESAPGRGYLERATALVDLFGRQLFSERHGVLLEHFAHDWSAHPDDGKRDVFEPGHHFEWVWLLRQYEKRAGADLAGLSRRLYESAQATRPGDTPLVDEVGADGVVRKASHRLWPHTEAIKAAAVRHDDGDIAARPFAQAMMGVLREVFLDRPFRGGWTDHVDAARRPLVDYVPASSLYHLMLAGAEADRAFARAG